MDLQSSQSSLTSKKLDPTRLKSKTKTTSKENRLKEGRNPALANHRPSPPEVQGGRKNNLQIVSDQTGKNDRHPARTLLLTSGAATGRVSHIPRPRSLASTVRPQSVLLPTSTRPSKNPIKTRRNATPGRRLQVGQAHQSLAKAEKQVWVRSGDSMIKRSRI